MSIIAPVLKNSTDTFVIVLGRNGPEILADWEVGPKRRCACRGLTLSTAQRVVERLARVREAAYRRAAAGV